MKFEEAKEQFVNSWGAFGSQWGINRTMAQIHALLLVSVHPLSQDDVMQQLNISRGNTNMNIRDLIDWGLVERVIITGERKEYFVAEKDIWKVAILIIKERKKRELEPMMKFLEQLKEMDGDAKSEEVKMFTNTINDIHSLVKKTDTILNQTIKAEQNWLLNSIIKVLK
jgi:DNA-binding transcriptional regulator GbsR (MarR family)